MNALPDDLRLLATLLANGLMLAAAWRIARQHNRRAVVALPDAILIWLAAQYVIAGTCGMLGILWPGLYLSIAAALSIAVLCRGGLGRRTLDDAHEVAIQAGTAAKAAPTSVEIHARFCEEDRVVFAAFAFVAVYAGAFLYHQRWLPELATDPIVYHIPAAAQWLQAGRIGLVDFWYWLAANTYSPLAGSVWIAWWLGPLGNDALSRFVQLPTWLLLFAVALRVLRDLRVPSILAAIAAITLVVARPFVSQLIIAKDDIPVAALTITLLGAMHPRRLREPGSPIRIGLALGLLMSIKYTAALAVPVIVPAILLMRWRLLGLRGALVAAAIALAFVGPWLIRNAIVTGNPVFPIASGSGGFIADPNLRSFAGVYHVLAGSHHSLPVAMWVALVASWLAVVVLTIRRRDWRIDSTRLALLIGPPMAIVLLVAVFPFAEIRYLFTALAALLILVGVALAQIRDRRVGIGLAGVVLIVSLTTSFIASWLPFVAGFFVAGVIGAGATLGLSVVRRHTTARARQIILVSATALLALGLYVKWTAYLRHPDAGYARSTEDAWGEQYGDVATMWKTLRANVPAGSTIAFVNTPTTWPLFGFDLQFRVVYAPVRPGVTHLHDLPPIRERVPARDEYIVETRRLTDGADASTWLTNLRGMRVDYVFVSKHDASDHPPELRFIAEHPDRFEQMAENDAAIVLRFRR